MCDNLTCCGKEVRADREKVQEWEEWAILDSPDDMANKGHHLRVMGGTILGVGVAVTLGALAIPLAGFGAAGVAAGSIAAATQSAVYGGATTGIFSILQSIGATMAWVTPAVAGGAMTATGGAALAAGNRKNG